MTGARRAEAAAFGGGKAKALFDLLLAARGGVVSVADLAAALWRDGQGAPRHPEASVFAYVQVLRNRIQPDGAPEDSVVVAEAGGFRLDLSRATLAAPDPAAAARIAG